jgi:hypothetical protein
MVWTSHHTSLTHAVRLVSIRGLFFVVCGLFWTLPERFRWVLLLVSSYYFYMCWRPEYALVLVVITAIDFFVGVSRARATQPKGRRAIFPGSVR